MADIGHIKEFSSSLNLSRHRSAINAFVHIIAAITATRLTRSSPSSIFSPAISSKQQPENPLSGLYLLPYRFRSQATGSQTGRAVPHRAADRRSFQPLADRDQQRSRISLPPVSGCEPMNLPTSHSAIQPPVLVLGASSLVGPFLVEAARDGPGYAPVAVLPPIKVLCRPRSSGAALMWRPRATGRSNRVRPCFPCCRSGFCHPCCRPSAGGPDRRIGVHERTRQVGQRRSG